MEKSESTTERSLILGDRIYVDEAFVTDEILSEYESKVLIGEDPYSEEPLYQTYYHYERILQGNDQSVIAFNRGDLNKIPRLFPGFQVIDKRLESPMEANLKIQFKNGKTWRPYQPTAVETLLSRDDGILQAPPRSGKTLLIVGAICMERQKTIVFAHQTDLLLQLLDTFEEFTNLLELEKKAEKKIVGFCEDWDDFEKLDVVLCTKQTFDNLKNRHKAKKIQHLFGSVYIDEVHLLAADVYSKLINKFWAKYRHGVSATPHRKDGKDVIIDGVMGPIIHKITRDEVGQVP